jgi:DNA mismatch endonuclease, patch repair protein
MTDTMTRAQRSRCMAAVRSRDTSPERLAAGLLRDLGVRFRRNVKSLPGSPDLVVSSRRVAVFVHGCFWHAHENCPKATVPKSNRRFWTAKLDRNRQRDRSTVRRLRRLGWSVLTVWTCKLTTSRIASVRSRLGKALDVDSYRA